MRMPWGKALASLFLAVTLSSVSWGNEPNTNPARATPGTLNYVEGQASIGTEALDSKSVGSADLQSGQSLTTEQGKAEILLTPGVFLRVGDNSSVKMISPSLTNTELEIDRGQAMIEVAEIHPENDIRISTNGAVARILKTGLYDFDQNQDVLRVFDGKASVENANGNVDVKGGHELTLESSGKYKAHKFDKKAYQENDLYRWSSLRSAYLAEANIDAASRYAANAWVGPGWWGWDWDPWFGAYTFMPWNGIFYSPFGWGFYSPWWVYQAPLYGFYGPGYGHFYHHFSTNYRDWGPGNHYVIGRNYTGGIYHGPGSTSRGFHSGPMYSSRSFGGGYHGGFHSGGGGFHGSGGGFHGGGFGGGGGSHGR
jgi:hypothetical protein